MARIDRLSVLLSRFQISVAVAPAGAGNLIILGDAGSNTPQMIEFYPHGSAGAHTPDKVVLFEAVAEWGGNTNPLVAALPHRLSLSMTDSDETALLLRVLLIEANGKRCGASSVLNRLGEVLIIRLLRAEIEKGSTKPGLLAGLADPRISKVIVAIHENPGRVWRNDDLAEIAGLSLSRFSEIFHARLEQTPQAYLRRWRLTLAHQDIEHGNRINVVSRRYGYASSEAFARAFQRQYGKKPLAARQVSSTV